MSPSRENSSIATTKPAKHSTGPRTALGKQRSRYNALKHGIFLRAVAKDDCVGEPGEENDYRSILSALCKSINPVTALEGILVEALAFDFLRLARLYRADCKVAGLLWKDLEKMVGSDYPALTVSEANEGEFVALKRWPSPELMLRYESAVWRKIEEKLNLIARLQCWNTSEPVLLPRKHNG